MSGKPILVALDGSDLSERTLPYAAAFARATEASVHVVTVWEEGERALIAQIPDVSESVFKKGEEHWEQYLSGHVAALQSDGVDVEYEVLIGDPANKILELVDQGRFGYLMLASHGRSGLNRWRYGSVTSSLLREARISTFVIGPAVLETERAEAAVSRILVPLDGSPLAESALPEAKNLANELHADVVLARTLQWSAQASMYGVPNVNVSDIDRDITEQAESYLSEAAKTFDGHARVETVVLHGPPADTLINLVSERQVDLVVMTSHARSGVARAVLGSVADRLLQSEAPVLLVRPGLSD